MKRGIIPAILGSMAIAASAADTPQFPGGPDAMDQFIASVLEYPAAALDNSVEGVVHVGFTVHADGSISGAKILRPIDPDLEREALRVIKQMPRWEPSEKEGKPVDAPATVAITFRIPE